jgi:hypothetical protein
MKRVKYKSIEKEMIKHNESPTNMASLIDTTVQTFMYKMQGLRDWKISEIETLCKHYDKDYYELFKKEGD